MLKYIIASLNVNTVENFVEEEKVINNFIDAKEH